MKAAASRTVAAILAAMLVIGMMPATSYADEGDKRLEATAVLDVVADEIREEVTETEPVIELYIEPDHPRICGERAISRTENRCKRGITPAYAGNALGYSRIYPSRRDHPRICGERAGAPGRLGATAGITPAYAGNARYLAST